MTPISDIEKLERLLAEFANNILLGKHDAWIDQQKAIIKMHQCNLAPSLIADWREMRGEIERLTKERDEAHEEGYPRKSCTTT